MQRLKRSPLYLWLVHHGNKIMDGFSDSTVSPGNNDKGDKNVAASASVASGLNVNNSSDPKELIPLTHDEVTSERPHRNEFPEDNIYDTNTESLYPDEVTTITYMKPIPETLYTDEVTTITYMKPINETSYIKKVSSANYEEPISEPPQPNELILGGHRFICENTAQYELESSSKLINSIPYLNEPTEVTCGRSTKENTSQYEFISVPCDGATSKIAPAYEFITTSCGEATNESKVPPEMKTVLSSRLNSASKAPSDMVTLSSRLNSASSAVSGMTKQTEEENVNENMLEKLSKMDEEVPISQKSTMKKIVNSIVSSVVFRILGILLVFVDISIAITDLVATEILFIHLECHSISLFIALFFVTDVLSHIYIEGRQKYFSDLLNVFDVIIIGLTLMVDIFYVSYDFKSLKNMSSYSVALRPLRLVVLVRVFHLANQKRHLEKLARRLVSGNKRRFKKDGFDLDLTYVTEQIIAMSFPSSGQQSFYRNPIEEVARFLDTRHPNHYRVYNLCSERGYDPKYFHYRVQRIMIDDHNVPTLNDMMMFTHEVQEWLTTDKENVVAIHCMGGKGRTGTMICAYLLASKLSLNAKESLFYFGERRTDKRWSTKYQGVETPSQNRYVGYFEDIILDHNGSIPPRQIFRIKRFVIYSIHGVGNGDGSDLKIHIIMHQKIVFYSSFKNIKTFLDIETDRVIIYVFNCPALYDDVKVKFTFSSDLPKYYENCSFFFWFHTAFIRNNRLFLARNELDNLHKPKTWKFYRPEFAVEVYFEDT